MPGCLLYLWWTHGGPLLVRLYADMDVRCCLSVHEFSRGTLLCVLFSRSGDSGLQCLLRIEGKSPSLCIQITLAAVAVKRREIKQLPKQHTQSNAQSNKGSSRQQCSSGSVGCRKANSETAPCYSPSILILLQNPGNSVSM